MSFVPGQGWVGALVEYRHSWLTLLAQIATGSGEVEEDVALVALVYVASDSGRLNRRDPPRSGGACRSRT
jgi:hypothetical protein